jgi:glycerol-3-phosphate dehydrogenase
VYAEAADGRPFFIVPWNGLYLIGTTDERYSGDPGAARIDAAEYRYLVRAAERLFPCAAPLDQHVCYTQAGIRPLPRSTQSRTGAITRRHLIHAQRNARGLFSIVGGKLTTHRALAEDVLRRLPRGPGAAPSSATRDRRLPGALDEDERGELLAAVGAALGAPQAVRLWQIYGARAEQIAALARSSPELAMVVDGGSQTLVAELVHAVHDEWATSLEDILQRRCMAGLAADRGLKTSPAAAQWLVRLGVWDKARSAEEVATYRALVRRFELPELGASDPSFPERLGVV